ncbi:hypothetical protein ONS95_000814 [Cadophora gregata]|uniref:uncharacterized protein n=1 Tax=Cadophora gregata TaxID=51156 RepID=UPI0026DADE6D|nr:uncharacterized protein ONS95_000814 [Cadophora gregata]KAK0103002.1 hypothetical protein ONS96_005615 [Cadophora gregata f. sp. sojae]KAK0128866.1 hypothetical protein ONS95_000814 [Cadophora gregata]
MRERQPVGSKGGTVWYENREALGPGKGADESDKRARKEATIYEALGQHDRILPYFGLETFSVGHKGTKPMAWAIRLGRALNGVLRDHIVKTATSPPAEQTRLKLAVQFAQGVAHIHSCNVIWGDLSTRNALLFDDVCLKLCDFADSDLMDNYPGDWYGCEDRYCPPGSERPQFHDIGTMNREIFALGTAIYEIIEWKVLYGPETAEDEVLDALVDGIWPQISSDNSVEGIIRRCWEYKYESSQQVVNDLQSPLSLRFKTEIT